MVCFVPAVMQKYGRIMYINLLLGVVVLVVIWLYLRKVLVKDDHEQEGDAPLRESPVDLLEKEVAKRRALEEDSARAFERLKDTGAERMRAVVAALEEIRSALPSVIGDSSRGAQKSLCWDDAGDRVVVRIRQEGTEEPEASIVVGWRVPELDLRDAARPEGKLAGEYFFRRSDTGAEECAADPDACMRAVTAFIVDFMA